MITCNKCKMPIYPNDGVKVVVNDKGLTHLFHDQCIHGDEITGICIAGSREPGIYFENES